MAEVAAQTYDLVGRELNVCFAEARAALELFAEQPDNPAPLQRCATELHRSQGVMRLLEIYGAALLAEEMEHVAHYLLAAEERKNQAESLDALLRAIVQLPSYVDRVLAGARDLALVLLPLLNDLRAVRGSPLLSEGTLLLLNLKSDKQPSSADKPIAPAEMTRSTRRLRAQFQTGLIGWIRGERVDYNLEILAAVSQRLEQLTAEKSIYQLWWVAGAVIEALRDNGLEGGVSVKRLLGLADREIKRLYEQGPARYCQTPPVELLNNLLYYVARSQSTGPRISAVRQSFRLDELLPVDQAVEEERDTLSAPSVKLMQTVGVAIREDLGKVKDVLDIFVRRGSGQPAELAPQVAMLRKIGDTLGVLGLGELRASILEETEQLDAISANRMPVDDGALLSIASTLINVEDRLDASLMRMIMPQRQANVARPGDEPAASEEFLPVQAAVLRECSINLARIKETISHNVSGTLDVAALDHWPELMRGIKAGLLMLSRKRAASQVEELATAMHRVMQPGGANLPPGYLDRLADALVSLEYYMDALQAGRSEPHYMLDNAQRCLDLLGREVNTGLHPVAVLGSDSHANTVVLEPMAKSGTVPLATTRRDLRVPSIVATLPPVLNASNSPGAALDVDADDELLAIFIEEAREEVARIGENFPIWDQNVNEHSALMTVRRSFHTLKGSGRMVGARDLAEFAWAVENLLNRLLDNTLGRSAPIVAVLREAVATVSQLVEHLARGPAPRANTTDIIRRAHALAAAQVSAASNTESELAAEPAAAHAPQDIVLPQAAVTAANATQPIETMTPPGDTTAPGDAAARADAAAKADAAEDALQLREIYLRETNAHVATVRDFLTRINAEPEPHRLTEEVYRACHTLSGSSKMAEARHGIRLAEPVDRWLRKAFAGTAGLTDNDLRLLGECMNAMEQVALNLDETTVFFLPHDVLRARIAAAESDLDRRTAQANTTNNDTAVMLQSADEANVAPADYDPEIAMIFVEEATELVDAVEHALVGWTTGRADPDVLAALKRPLHTLKGGARMASVMPMGELAHELETLIGQIELGSVAPDERTRGVLQSSIDELARMRGIVAAGRPLLPARDALQRIASLMGGGAQVSAPEPVQELAAVAPPPTLEEVPLDEVLSPPPAEAPPMESPHSESAQGESPVSEVAAATAIEFASRVEASGPREMPPGMPLAGPAAVPPGREPVAGADKPEMARVDAELLDQLLNNAGEVSIGRARLEQQIGSIDHNLAELSRTVTRLKEQLRNLEIETEKQILHRYENEGGHRGDFDPLELDRYSSIQQFSRALAETASDVASIQQLLATLTQDTQNLLQQQARTVTELQNGLMRTRMVPFQRHVQRLSRIVRTAAADTHKRAEFVVEGAAGELDRQVLERMLPPFEHILRNAVVHGIETPAERIAAGKSEAGRITLALRREGSEVVVEITDDGAGMNLKAIRDKAQVLGIVKPGQTISDSEAMQLTLETGFSTAGSITQHAGRGVGMDVVATEIKKLGGALQMHTEAGVGSRFTIRLPFTLAISHALVVRVADEYYALPLPTVEGVVRLARDEVERYLAMPDAAFEYSGQSYRFQQLGAFVGLESGPLPVQDVTIPVVLVRAGDHSTGLVTEELIGSREIVVKSVGPQISAIRGISGATILGDGRIVIILDINALVRADWRARTQPLVLRDRVDARPVALVVDDSITVRRVTQRLLERNGMRVLTARDGLDAVLVLADNLPDIILLDIEMPRMDGYEVAAHVRNDQRLRDIPIIMITSRSGEKHRARAIELGVDDYLGKPYQEAQLLEAIEPLISRRRGAHNG